MDRNPTEHAHYNKAISYDYLVVVNNRYGRGVFSFISNKWMITEQLIIPIRRDIDKSKIDIHRQNDFSPSKLIWFEEIDEDEIL